MMDTWTPCTPPGTTRGALASVALMGPLKTETAANCWPHCGYAQGASRLHSDPPDGAANKWELACRHCSALLAARIQVMLRQRNIHGIKTCGLGIQLCPQHGTCAHAEDRR